MNYMSRPRRTIKEQVDDGIRHHLFGWVPRPRNGKVAKLPEGIRNRINQMLEDNVPYAAILEKLKQSGDAPLPYPISEMNLSNWYQGGYQDYLHQCLMAEALKPKTLPANPAANTFLTVPNGF